MEFGISLSGQGSGFHGHCGVGIQSLNNSNPPETEAPKSYRKKACRSFASMRRTHKDNLNNDRDANPRNTCHATPRGLVRNKGIHYMGSRVYGFSGDTKMEP